jgi:hypothetical protein
LLEARISNGDEPHLQQAMMVAIRIMEARVRVLLHKVVEKMMLVAPYITSLFGHHTTLLYYNH